MTHTNRKIVLLAALTVLTLGALGAAQAAEYAIDPAHSTIGFQIRHLTISKVNGKFDAFKGGFTFVKDDPSSWQAEVSIDAASINTGNEKRDEHLRSTDFFDVARFPTITFKSTAVSMKEGNEGTVTGDLTMHGVTRSVTLDVEFLGEVNDPWGNERAGFSLRGKINRQDFGLTWSKALETGGFVVGDEVKLLIEVEGVKK